MVAFSLIGMLCGILLGLRFGVLSVVLAHAMAAGLILGFAFSLNSSWGFALGALLCWSLGSQVGYVAGVMLPRHARALQGHAQKA